MLWQILVLAALIETLVEVVKWTFDGEMSKWRIVAFVSGMLITPLTGLDIFQAVGLPLAVPFIDPALGLTIGSGVAWIFTGAIASRGSTVVNDVFSLLSKLREAFGNIPNLPGGSQ